MVNAVFVAHTAEYGGGELGLARYLASTSRGTAAELIVLGGQGVLLASSRENGVPAISLGREVTTPFGLVPRSLRLWKALRRSSANVVVANDYHSAVLMTLLPKGKKRLVFYMRNGLRQNPGRGIIWIVVTRFLFRRIDVFVANSKWTYSTLPRVLSKKPHFIATPVSGDFASEVDTDVHDRGLVVLTMSRLVPWKGVHVLIAAMKIAQHRGVRGLRLRIVGTGDPEYVELIKNHLSTAEFEWSMDGYTDDIRTPLADADVVACPSIEPEPFGQVIIQGLASGRLVVATDAGGAREILEGCVAGSLVPANDAEALGEELVKLSALGGEERQKRSAAARIRAARFSDAAAVHALDLAIQLSE